MTKSHDAGGFWHNAENMNQEFDMWLDANGVRVPGCKPVPAADILAYINMLQETLQKIRDRVEFDCSEDAVSDVEYLVELAIGKRNAT